MVRFVDEAEIDARYWEKPYYLLPDGEDDEGYTVIRDALKQTRKVAIGQLIMHGRGHLVGIKAQGKGLTLSILRYGNEVRDAEPYFERLTTKKPDTASVALAKELIKRMSGRFEPEKMPDEYAEAVQELVRAKVENRAPEVVIEPDGKPRAEVINIMDALKASMQKQGQAKVRDAVRKRMGKAASKEQAPPRTTRTRPSSRRGLH